MKVKVSGTGMASQTRRLSLWERQTGDQINQTVDSARGKSVLPYIQTGSGMMSAATSHPSRQYVNGPHLQIKVYFRTLHSDCWARC